MINDERLDTIMKEYVSRDIEPFTYSKKRVKKRKYIPALAAVLCILIISGIILIPSGSHSFVITVNAQESTPQEISDKSFVEMSLVTYGGGGMTSSGSEVETVDHISNLDLSVKGDGIKTVKYTVKGKYARLILSAECDKAIDSSGGADGFKIGDSEIASWWMDEETGCAHFDRYYYSLTFPYDNQPDDNEMKLMFGGVNGENIDEAIINTYQSTQDPSIKPSFEIDSIYDLTGMYFDELLKDVVLDVCIGYENGKEESRTFSLECILDESVEIDEKYYAYTHVKDENSTDELNRSLIVPVHSFYDAGVGDTVIPVLCEDYDSDPLTFSNWVTSNFANTEFSFVSDDVIGFTRYDNRVILRGKLIET